MMAEGPPKRCLNRKSKKLHKTQTKGELPNKLKADCSGKQRLTTESVLHFSTQQKEKYPKKCCIVKKEEIIATAEVNAIDLYCMTLIMFSRLLLPS